MAKLRAFRLAAALVPFIPLWLAYPGARLAGGIIWACAGQLRRRVERNLRHIPTLAHDPVALRRAARGVFANMVLNYFDFLRGPRLTDKQVLAGWTTEGEDDVDTLMRQGRGLIAVSAHFGNFEYGASRLGALGYQMTTPVERVQPEALYTWFRKTREHHNMRLFPADSRETLREMMGALKRNEMVLIAADRYIIGSSIEVPFFGEPARLPTSAFSLALKTGAPIIATFSWRLGRGRSHGVVIPLNLQPDKPETSNSNDGGDGGDSGDDGDRSDRSAGRGNAASRTRNNEAETARAVRLYVEQLERLITAHPEQWVSTLATIWEPAQENAPLPAFGRTDHQPDKQTDNQSAIQSA